MSEPARKHLDAIRVEPDAVSLPDSGALSNRELIDWLREDPGRAAPVLYERFAPEVNRLVWRLLGADPDHNDLVQQILYRVMVNAHRVREPDRLGAWIRSVTVRTVYSELRRRELRRLLLRQAPEPQSHADLVRDVEARDLLQRARVLLAKLPPRERIVFTLHFVEGRTLAEIGELLGFSTTTAKRRLKRADQRFRLLARQHPEVLGLLGKDAHGLVE